MVIKINNQSLYGEIPLDIINILRFFIRIQNFSYVDRIGNALSSEPIEMALKDALRDYRSIYNGAVKKNGSRIFTDKRSGKSFPLYKIPKQESIEKVLSLIQTDASYGRKLAILALTIKYSKNKQKGDK
ncbi:MAG: type I-A CRISPR-associated protein Csa5 [Candidatus Heimdallarchaeota archaeon]|nr:type I-A CRISPR-associated protein Csa5 [Candidatus Heimdallarchaeota archaeon]